MTDTLIKKLPRVPLLTPDQEVELTNVVRDATVAAWVAVFQNSDARREHDVTGRSAAAILDAAKSKLETDKDREQLAIDVKRCPAAQPHWHRMLQARDRMMRANMGLVLPIASRWKSLEVNDAVQEGCIGLMRAVYRFDPSMGTRFSTYATPWIQQSAQRLLETRGRTIRVSDETVQAKRKIERHAISMAAARGEAVADTEAARDLGLDPELAARALEAPLAGFSVHNLTRSGDGETASEYQDFIVGASVDPLEVLAGEDRARLAQVNLKRLGPIARDMMLRRHGDAQQRMHEIATAYGMTRERVRCILAQAVLQMQLMNKRGAA